MTDPNAMLAAFQQANRGASRSALSPSTPVVGATRTFRSLSRVPPPESDRRSIALFSLRRSSRRDRRFRRHLRTGRGDVLPGLGAFAGDAQRDLAERHERRARHASHGVQGGYGARRRAARAAGAPTALVRQAASPGPRRVGHVRRGAQEVLRALLEAPGRQAGPGGAGGRREVPEQGEARPGAHQAAPGGHHGWLDGCDIARPLQRRHARDVQGD